MTTTRPDSSTPPVTVPEAGTPEANTMTDSGGSMPPSICADASTCAVVLTAAAPAIAADGKATNLITATVDFRLTGTPVEFSIRGPGKWTNGQLVTADIVDANGKATATFVSDSGGGTATITAKLMGHDAAALIAVDMPPLADITYTTQHTLMGVKSSGFNESNQITFKILAPNGMPYPAGLSVEFEHKPLAGSTIGNQPTCTMLDCVVKDTGITDEKGLVQLSLASGTLQGAATVTITATAGGQTKRVDVSSPIVGAKVSGRNISIECTPRNVPAFADTDCIRSRVDAPFKCTVTLGDRFSNEVGIRTTVKFQSEAGIVGPPAYTPEFPSMDLGKATGTIGTIGGVLPLDVSAIAGEYSLVFADACHPTGPTPTHNPRDGIVSVIAMMTGEEGFIDKNGDGIYNPMEPFIDLAEPLVDSNDNGIYDAGEFFQDLNGDQKWNPPNGMWDASTTLWTETRIVYSSGPGVVTDSSTGNHFQSRFFPWPHSLPDVFGPTSDLVEVLLMLNETRDIGIWFSDRNFNVLAPAVKYSVEVGSGDPITAAIAASPTMAPGREEGFFFAQHYCDGAALSAPCEAICPPRPQTQQCLVKSSVGQFEYGVNGVVRIKASSSISGSFGIASTATILNLATSLGLTGNVRP